MLPCPAVSGDLLASMIAARKSLAPARRGELGGTYLSSATCLLRPPLFSEASLV